MNDFPEFGGILTEGKPSGDIILSAIGDAETGDSNLRHWSLHLLRMERMPGLPECRIITPNISVAIDVSVVQPSSTGTSRGGLQYACELRAVQLDAVPGPG